MCSLSYLACKEHTPCRIVLPTVAHLISHVFPPYLVSGTIFPKNVIEHKMGVLIFSTNFFKVFFILRIILRDINVRTFSCKVPVIMARF